ncbi:MAG: TonB family protein [Acidobacteriia bacterium]|nr:TonB family protein [Terriglobia bacterium]
MQLAKKAVINEAVTASDRGLQLVIEPEPWVRIFLRNIADLFRAGPPPAWVTSLPGEYWADALVNRPVAWRAVRQSFLGHTLVIVAVYALNLAWLNQPQILPEAPRTQSVLHYELSEYLPAVNSRKTKPEPPRRAKPQKADPEFAPQEIVVTNANHISTRQTIVQPNPVFLKQDVPLPNLIASTTIPGAPVAMHRPLQILPVNVPQVAPPAPVVAQSSLRPLVFPPAAQPEAVAPVGAAANRRTLQALPLESAVAIPPAPEMMPHRADALQIPAQAPPQVAAPAAEVSSSRALQSIPPLTTPQVAAPAPAAANRSLGSLGLPAQDATAIPPAPAVISGSAAREKEMGQMLVLNARPIVPVGPVTVPEGNRPGEFTASPSGRAGATARPEIARSETKEGSSPSAANRSGSGASPGDIYVSAPPAKVTGNTVVASAAPPPAAKPLTPDRTDLPRVDTQVFGTRRHYSMRLSMPNLTSSTGSWTIRFAEMNAAGHGESDLSAPEAIKKVDPAYPQELMHDRVEGVVVLYAVIHSDGSVGEVRVLEGFDERLNENARKALAQWRFRPGTKEGMPVDVEAVVRVPFKVPRSPF